MVKKKEVKKVKVRLLKSHEHAGKKCEKGKVIEVREDQAQRLKSWGVAEEVK